MSTWPSGMTLRPIGTWPGTMATSRGRSPFSSTLSATLDLLKTELAGIRGRNVVMQIALEEGQFRIDGMPRAGAIPAHPGVILSMETPDGSISFPCDKFRYWEDNLRAIVLTMKRLREAGFYGVVKHGEQYTGWRAIESGARAMPSTPFSREPADVIGWLENTFGISEPGDNAKLLRKAQRAAHPDMGGDTQSFQLVSIAEGYLRDAGVL